MQTSITLSALFIAAVSAAAIAPRAPRTVPIYVCTDANFKGYCNTLNSPSQTCYQMQGFLYSSVSSLEIQSYDLPAGNTHGCSFYDGDNCSGNAFGTGNGHRYNDLGQDPQGGKFNDRIRSYICLA